MSKLEVNKGEGWGLQSTINSHEERFPLQEQVMTPRNEQMAHRMAEWTIVTCGRGLLQRQQ